MNVVKKTLLMQRVKAEYKIAKYQNILDGEVSEAMKRLYTVKRDLKMQELGAILKTLGTLLLIIYMNISGLSQSEYKAYLINSGDTLFTLKIIDINLTEASKKVKHIAADHNCTYKIRRIRRVSKKLKKEIIYE